MDLGLHGKKAIVTGGTRGIGRAIASLLAAEGCDVAICARHKEAVDETVASLGRAGVKATGGTVDVADLPALRRWVGEAAETFGGLDIFVANVSALAQGMDEDAWRKAGRGSKWFVREVPAAPPGRGGYASPFPRALPHER